MAVRAIHTRQPQRRLDFCLVYLWGIWEAAVSIL